MIVACAFAPHGYLEVAYTEMCDKTMVDVVWESSLVVLGTAAADECWVGGHVMLAMYVVGKDLAHASCTCEDTLYLCGSLTRAAVDNTCKGVVSNVA